MTWQNGIYEGKKNKRELAQRLCLHAYQRRRVLLFTLPQQVTNVFTFQLRTSRPKDKIRATKNTYWSKFPFLALISSKYTFSKNKLFSCPLGSHGAVSVRAECLSKAQAAFSIWPHCSTISRVLLGSKSSKSLVRPEALSSTASHQR